MKNKQRYRIWCNQRNIYFADRATFSTLQEIRQQLIDYHSIDCNGKSLHKQTLADIVDGFEWEVHYLNGTPINYNVLKQIK